MEFHIPPVYFGEEFAYMAYAPSSWAMEVFHINALRSQTNGRGVRTAVLDTGADVSHPEIGGRIVLSRDFTNSRIGFRDAHGHGTHCISTVGGVSPGVGVADCEIINCKVLGDSGSGSDRSIAAGVEYAVSVGAEVISMSLGSSSSSPTIHAAIQRAEAAGVWVIAAAGNEGRAGVGYPGQYPECISVAAIDRAMRVADFSSRGTKLDCSGPGVDILGAKVGGGYRMMSGTSMACPFIAGMMSLLRQALKDRGQTFGGAQWLRDALQSAAVDLGKPGVDTDYGPGWLAPSLVATVAMGIPKPLEG